MADTSLQIPAQSTMVQSTTTEQVTARVPQQSLLSRHLRNIIALALTGVVIYLAIMGDMAAQAALTAAFSVLVGMIFGERSALKKPGVDQ